MTVDQLPWAIGLLLVALVIAVLNDMTRFKDARRKSEKRAPGSVLGSLIGIVLTAGVIVVGIAFGRDVPSLRWLVPAAFVGVVLLVLAFLLRKAIWLYLKSAATGRFPQVIRRNAGGELEMKCPRCSANVSVAESQIGETAFDCPFCGEKARWASQLKS